jgi:hypothetical protein
LASAIALLGLSAFSVAPASAQRGNDQVTPLRFVNKREQDCQARCMRSAQTCHANAKSPSAKEACEGGVSSCYARCR